MSLGAIMCLFFSFEALCAEPKNKDAMLPAAASLGEWVFVKDLLKKGFPINATDGEGNSALSWAVKKDEPKWIEFLIHKGADVNLPNKYGWTPLMNAVHSKDLVKLFVEKGADVNARNRAGWTPMMFAELYDNNQDVKTLLKKKGVILSSSHVVLDLSLIAAACRGGKKYDGFPPYPGRPKEFPKKNIKELVSEGANVNGQDPEGNTPLIFAANVGNLEAVKDLLSLSADVNIQNQFYETPLFFAARGGHEEIVSILIEKGTHLGQKNEYDENVFLVAAEEGKTSILELLLKKGMSGKYKTKLGYTALTYACAQGHTESAKLLIENGADLNVKTNDGDTPLRIAIKKGFDDIVKLLKTAGARE